MCVQELESGWWGAAGGGSLILRDLLALGCEVTVAVRTEASRVAALEGGAAKVVPSVGRLPPVDGIVIATPTKARAEVAETALELGVPIFVEKPLTDDPVRRRRQRAGVMNSRAAVTARPDTILPDA